ncbi:unnamed protein product [Euphydryas editha]|uniref:Uncharacterized protein n=1 Tax=Euphydryas editha TaxID=104508 RepID=A0AAU9TF49_EUPED|nr:unnamed protein product [Euphydryas editha]
MCQSKVEKEDVFLAQTASGGDNDAHLQHIKAHMSTMNVLLIVIMIALLLGGFFVLLRFYKKCHQSWINSAMRDESIRRSVSRRFREARERGARQHESGAGPNV